MSEFHNADCTEGMKSFPDKRYFDLAQARLGEARAQIAMEIRIQ